MFSLDGSKALAVIRKASELHRKDVKEAGESWKRERASNRELIILYETPSDGARHRTTLCLCRAVSQSSTEGQHTWPEMMAEIVAMCKSYVG